MIQKSYDDTASLYLIPTPIGNLDDITVRSLNVLKTVDELLCEDTRDTGLLLSHYGIKKKLVSCHEFNEEKMIDYVVSKLKEGYNLGLVTDQGTPIISDPGYIVSRGVIEAGYNVISLPGATAFVPALVDSALPDDRFCFEGFLPQKKGRQTRLMALADETRTMVFYESPHRLVKTLQQLAEVLGESRRACVVREIAKVHEESVRGTLNALTDHFTEKPPRGEIVIVVAGCDEKTKDKA